MERIIFVPGDGKTTCFRYCKAEMCAQDSDLCVPHKDGDKEEKMNNSRKFWGKFQVFLCVFFCSKM